MRTNKNLILLNFACIYFVWGANYLIVKNTLQWFPPYTLVFLRLSTASLIAFTIARIRRDIFPSRKQIKNALLVGVFFFILCNSIIVWSQQYMDSGLVAILLCSQPLFIAIIHHLIQRKSIPLLLLTGIMCGAAGVYLLQGTSGDRQKVSALFVLLVIVASMFGAMGAVLSRRLDLPSSPWMNTGIQMSFASLIGGSIAAWNGDLWKFSPSDIPMNSWYSFFYLVLFGSIVSYSAYNYLLVRVTPNAVATHSFVNPLVALLLGAAISGEFYGVEMLLPTFLLLSAVVLMLWSERNAARTLEKRVV